MSFNGFYLLRLLSLPLLLYVHLMIKQKTIQI
nr:MAG TPA: hypothetical protein [Caudoviricetes sp.]